MGTAVIVTGMHRSGTSLLANLLQEAGLCVGERLKGPTTHNVKGHFEDMDFVELHDEILAANGTSMYLENVPEVLQISDEHRARAGDLINKRRDLPVWGWKDPRTTLFLDFWHGLLPKAKFVFIFRRAEQVVDSLRRRSDKPLNYQFHGAWPLRKLGFSTFKMKQAVHLWLHYNREIVRFVHEHPQASCVLDLAALATQVPAALRTMRDRWGLPFGDVAVSAVLEKDLLHEDVHPRVARACRQRADVTDMYNELQLLVHR